jgi:hypothetical protein
MVESEPENPAVSAENVAIKKLEDLDEPIDPRITSSSHDLEKHHLAVSIETKGTFPTGSAESRTVAIASLAEEEKGDFYVRFHFCPTPPALMMVLFPDRLETG